MDAKGAGPSTDVSLKLLEGRVREPCPGSSKRHFLDEDGASKDEGDNCLAVPVKNSPKNGLSVWAGRNRPWMGGFANADS